MSLAPQSVAYKESGIPWLGKIPKHWSIVRGVFLFFNKKVLNSELQCQERLALTMSGVIERDIEKNDGLNPADFRTYQIFQQDDLVFKLIDLDNLKTSRVGYVHKIGIMSSAYIRLIPRQGVFSKYFYYQYFDLYLKHIFNFLGTGVRSTLGCDELLDIKIMFPPLQEQKAIADFLDKKTHQIEEFIIKKQKLIILLEEKKQTLINQCVTQGLDSSTSLKDSGVEWLGKIPTHWQIKKLKYISKVVLGKMLCNEKQEGYSHCYYLKSKNLQWLNVDISQVEKMWFSEYEKSIYRVKKDDLLVSEGGEVGKTCIWNDEIEECYIQNSVHKITMDSLNHPRFFLYVFFVYGKKGVFESIVNRVSIAHLVLEKLINIDFAVPPLEEQKAIAEYLDTQIAKIDLAISKIKSQINLIKEYKSTLISEAVCGRVGRY